MKTGKENDIEEKLEKAIVDLRNGQIDILAVRELITEIKTKDGIDLSKFKAKLNEFDTILFARGINIDDDLLDKNKKEKKKLTKIKITNEEDFKTNLEKLYKLVQADIAVFRKNIFLKFGDSSSPLKVLLLYDIRSKTYLFEKIQTSFQNGLIYELSKFVEELKNKPSNFTSHNYLCLIIFSHSPDSKIILENLEVIKGYLQPITKINVNDEKEFTFSELSDFDLIKKEIQYIIEIELINKKLIPADEKILKMFFKDNDCYALEYETIDVGFSGSRIYQIVPRINIGEPVKYVIKVSSTNSNKISDEQDNFNKYVRLYDTRYNLDEAKIEKVHAIKYNFASNDSIANSKSFANYMMNNKSNEECVKIIKKLFAIKLFINWNSPITKSVTVKELYIDYIKFEEVKMAIAGILDYTDEIVNGLSLIQNFKKIFEYSLSLKVKVCHGDLHTENFFIDDNENVFLIDFGDTKNRHALIDHATLECSLKFRHVPFFIEMNILEKFEKELLQEKAFKVGFQPEANFRNDLIFYLELIKSIREDSCKFFHNNYVEYLVSLFMITFRQIQYKGLNQLYAYKSAELLSNKIVAELGL